MFITCVWRGMTHISPKSHDSFIRACSRINYFSQISYFSQIGRLIYLLMVRTTIFSGFWLLEGIGCRKKFITREIITVSPNFQQIGKVHIALINFNISFAMIAQQKLHQNCRWSEASFFHFGLILRAIVFFLFLAPLPKLSILPCFARVIFQKTPINHGG